METIEARFRSLADKSRFGGGLDLEAGHEFAKSCDRSLGSPIAKYFVPRNCANEWNMRLAGY